MGDRDQRRSDPVVRIRRSGAGRETFVLVHGIGTSHRYFKPLAETLARHGTVYSVDLPGFGGTPKRRRRLSVEDFARLTLQALQRQNVGSAVLVGHSMGCQIVVEMARQSTTTAAGLVLLGPTTDSRNRTALRQGARLLRDILREPFRSNLVVFTDYLRAGPIWYGRTLPAMLEYRTEEKIRAVRAPVLVVGGGRDPVAPSDWAHRLADLCRDGTVVEVPGQPHVVMLGAPETVGRLCRTLARTP